MTGAYVGRSPPAPNVRRLAPDRVARPQVRIHDDRENDPEVDVAIPASAPGAPRPHGDFDRRRLLLGDWHPLLRDGIDLLRLSLAGGAVAHAVGGDTGGAVVLALSAAAALVARVVNLPRVYDLAFVLALSLQGWGEATGLYDTLSWFDDVVHLVLPFLVAPVLYIALARLDVVPDPRDETHTRHYVGVAIVTFAAGGAAGAVWEVLEWVSDGLFATSLQQGNADTVTDLLLDLSGSLAGAVLLVVWTARSWGSVRRIPGENRFEDVSA